MTQMKKYYCKLLAVVLMVVIAFSNIATVFAASLVDELVVTQTSHIGNSH